MRIYENCRQVEIKSKCETGGGKKRQEKRPRVKYTSIYRL